MKHRRIDRRDQAWWLKTCAVVTFLALAVSGQAPPAAADETPELTMNCREKYREWRRMLPHGAFAASQLVNGQQACAHSRAWGSQKEAIAAAIRLCKRNDYFLNLKLGHTCRVVKAS